MLEHWLDSLQPEYRIILAYSVFSGVKPLVSYVIANVPVLMDYQVTLELSQQLGLIKKLATPTIKKYPPRDLRNAV